MLAGGRKVFVTAFVLPAEVPVHPDIGPAEAAGLFDFLTKRVPRAVLVHVGRLPLAEHLADVEEVLLTGRALRQRHVLPLRDEVLRSTPHAVALWRNRFVKDELAIRANRPRASRKPSKQQELAQKIIDTTTQVKPANTTHWSTRALAREPGVSQSMVHRVWKAAGLKPHLIKTFKLSNDPRFVEKMTDLVGLYPSPPEKALVLCVDEKSQCQALERTQKSQPLFPGRNGTLTHEVIDGMAQRHCSPR